MKRRTVIKQLAASVPGKISRRVDCGFAGFKAGIAICKCFNDRVNIIKLKSGMT